MPRRVLCPFGIMLLAASALYAQQTPPAANAWSVSRPYPNNPLRLATTSGRVSVADDTRAAQLEIECRAPQLARVNLRLPAKDLKFNLDPFEGPPGVGQKRKLLSVQLNEGPATPHTFSGFYVESKTFVFATALPRSEMKRILSAEAASQRLQIKISPADGKGDPLIFHFTLPADSEPAFHVAQPCNDSKAKNREPDPQ